MKKSELNHHIWHICSQLYWNKPVNQYWINLIADAVPRKGYTYKVRFPRWTWEHVTYTVFDDKLVINAEGLGEHEFAIKHDLQ